MVVSEVLTFTNMNWALLAEEKWRGKVGNGEVVPYREAGEELTYKKIILNKLNFDVSGVTLTLTLTKWKTNASLLLREWKTFATLQKH